MTNNEIFEIVFYKDEYEKTPLAVCEPEIEAFQKTLKSLDKKISDNEIPSLFSTIVKTTTANIRRKIHSGLVIALQIKSNVSDVQICEYNEASKRPSQIVKETKTTVSKPKRKAHAAKQITKKKTTQKTYAKKAVKKSKTQSTTKRKVGCPRKSASKK